MLIGLRLNYSDLCFGVLFWIAVNSLALLPLYRPTACVQMQYGAEGDTG